MVVFQGGKINVDPALQISKDKIQVSGKYEDLRREPGSRKYSSKTIKSSIHYNEDFLKIAGKKPVDITEDDIKDYLFYLVTNEKSLPLL